MKVTGTRGVSGYTASRQSDVTLRLDSIRQGLRKHGAVMVNPDNKTDAEAIARLQKQFGAENVKVERSQNAKLTISNFKG
jgi:hypothetical protein